ncbi:MAG TPA: M28 family peptidase, partial [Gemmataceae bacterium]|nr:M28 family peptidase [Gemmataceae bacterium]
MLTFQPFGRLPKAVQKAYLTGDLHLIPFPGSLLFWGTAGCLRLQKDLPLAMQIPLLHSVVRHEDPRGIRVPQSGWLHETHPDRPNSGNHHGPIRNTFRRTHRWEKVHRDEDELAIEAKEEKLLHVLFSTSPDDLGLYGKPMAHNVQLWTHEFQLLLDGPQATPQEIKHAEHTMVKGGLFGYRFQYPAMRVGSHELYWHRPLLAYQSAKSREPVIFHDGPLGYFTAYNAENPNLSRPIELWPRVLQRELPAEALQIINHAHDPRPHQTVRNIRKLFQAQDFFKEKPVPCSFARQLLSLPKHQSLEDWCQALPRRCIETGRGLALAEKINHALEVPQSIKDSDRKPKACPSLTYQSTARRSFEIAYWRLIAHLAEGRYVNKDNADCIQDSTTQHLLTHQHRDLDALGDFILGYYTKLVTAAKMTGKVLVGDLPFTWQTDFDFSWSGGWLRNQEGRLQERNLIVVIPGKDRKRAVIMADHYDTAYMEDYYEGKVAGKGARLAAAGADDNHSATAALMLGAKVFLQLSRSGKLACDVWLIHLTGEEFPSDCMGARNLCQKLIEGNL